jgi:hypothetical protein
MDLRPKLADDFIEAIVDDLFSTDLQWAPSDDDADEE